MAADPSTLTSREFGGDDWTPWTPAEQLLALILDELRNANWQRSGKKSGRPKPVHPLPVPKRSTGQERSFEEIAAYLDQFNPALQPVDDEEEVTDG